jgi:hypothetical protein
MDFDEWPKIYWHEGLALIHEFLTDEELARLLGRVVLPDGPLVDWREVFDWTPGND